jgi:histidine triad (HIT) family protein
MDCVFCKIAKGEIKSEKIYENDNFFSIFDVDPQVKGHVLVISKKHFETILDMPASLGSEFLDCIKKTSLELVEKFKADAFNVVNNNFESAGQIVKHVHFHILPRRKGDGLYLSLRKK